MRFLDTDIQPNSETIFTLLKPIIASRMTTTIGLLCLAGGIAYYSWNKKQELNVNFVQKNNNEDEIKQTRNETSTHDIKNITTNNKSNTNEKETIEIEKLQKEENEDKKDYDMLDDINDAFKKENINNDDDWEIIDMLSNSSNYL